jgi:hypothetical protein
MTWPVVSGLAESPSNTTTTIQGEAGVGRAIRPELELGISGDWTDRDGKGHTSKRIVANHVGPDLRFVTVEIH